MPAKAATSHVATSAASRSRGSEAAPRLPEDQESSFPSWLRAASTADLPGHVLLPGDRLWKDRFEVERFLGAGAMGEVYGAFDRKRRETVALKTLQGLAPQDVYRFKLEFRSFVDRPHPNLVRHFELFHDPRCYFLTMELVGGEDLAECLLGADEATVRAHFRQLLVGVDAIHRAGFIHRDLKPSNVRVTALGRVVVLDFGLVVSARRDGPGRTLGADVAGTPAYMAPEQSRGEATTASDVYALGVMLGEALTGYRAVRARPGGRFDVERPGVPPDLGQLVLDMLHEDPLERPSVRAALARLQGEAASRRVVPRCPASPGISTVELGGLRAAMRRCSAGGGELQVLDASGADRRDARLHAAQRLAESEGWLVLRGRCDEREHLPLQTLDGPISALSRHLRRAGTALPSTLRPAEACALVAAFPALARVEVLWRAASEQAPCAAGHRSPSSAAERGLAELLGRIAQRRPLMLIVENLARGDRAGLRLLWSVFHRLCRHRARVLLAVTGLLDPPPALRTTTQHAAWAPVDGARDTLPGFRRPSRCC